MAAMWGQNIEQVRTLGNTMNQKAQQIQEILNLLTKQLNSTQWEGPDAQAFRSDFTGTHSASLRSVISALESAGQKALANAKAQESTSTNVNG